MSRIGWPEKRLEDGPLLRGAARFAADISFPDQVYMSVVRSPVARGRIRRIDVSDAQSLTGVAAVWTATDVAGIPPIDFRQVRVSGLEPYRQPILAATDLRYVGEPVAVVFADDAYLAEDAAELVDVEIEEMEPCLRSVDPPAQFAPGLSTEAAIIEKTCGNLQRAFDRADLVLELEFEVGRHSGVPLETRGGVATYDSGRDLVEIHGAAKIPHLNRQALAVQLGLDLENLHIYEGHVGGGFGIRGELYPEDVLLCLSARRLQRPVKWVEDRREHLIAANHSRDQVHSIRAALDKSGFMLGLDCEFWADQGAYVRTHAATVPDLTAALLPGPYLVPAYRARGHIRLTNKTPAGTYRAPGRYESTFVRERLMDAAAAKLGMDPLEIRRLNLIPREKMPFRRGLETLGTDVEYDTGDYGGLLDKTLEAIDYGSLKNSLAERRRNGELAGSGVAMFVEKSGLGPSDAVRLILDEQGDVEIVTGAASMGQGVETVLAQICSDVTGVALERIRVTHGQTDRIERGLGAFASRVTVMTGSAVQVASARLKVRILETASKVLQLPPEDLCIVEDSVQRMVDVDTGPSVRLEELASHSRFLVADATFSAEHMVYPYGVQVAVVSIDPETGGVSVERFIVGYDVGVSINPVLIDGQLAGGAAQGIGGALYEQFVYDNNGQPLAASFMDYLIPTATEIPLVETIVFEDAPSPLNPLGVKGAGEGGITAAGAAIAAAVDDALGNPGTIAGLPIQPALLRRAAARNSGARIL